MMAGMDSHCLNFPPSSGVESSDKRGTMSQRKPNASIFGRGEMPNNWTSSKMYQTSFDATENMFGLCPKAYVSKDVSRRSNATALEGLAKKSHLAVKLMGHYSQGKVVEKSMHRHKRWRRYLRSQHRQHESDVIARGENPSFQD